MKPDDTEQSDLESSIVVQAALLLLAILALIMLTGV